MIAKDIYILGRRAYNGDEDSRREWFRVLAPLAQVAAHPYGVLPGIVLARAGCESGWASDLYELAMERQFGVKFSRKAQNYNNLLGMVAYGRNDEYMPGIPTPAWASYKATFMDYGPHGDMSGQYGVTLESWKEYRSINDAFEDFCAVIRSQAYRRGEQWPSDLRGQLLSMGRGYTPEGAASKKGMDFSWQDKTLEFYEKYNLYQYDKKEGGKMAKVKMTLKNLEKYIVQAYKYAHEKCHYGRTDTHYPPGEPGKDYLDCVGLIYLALWLMGLFPSMLNIDQLQDLCLAIGFKKSTNPDDAWKRHGIVCMQDRNNHGTEHINHVYYSLGGKDSEHIGKYDLGSEERMRKMQPFKNVSVNEWTNTRDFLCMFYLPEEEKLPDTPSFNPREGAVGEIVKDAAMYAGPGAKWRKIRTVKTGELVRMYALATGTDGKIYRHIALSNGTTCYIRHAAVDRTVFEAYDGKVAGTDGHLSIRVGAGGGCYKIADIPEGKTVTVNGSATASDGSAWLHVVYKAGGKNLRGYVAAQYVIKA